MLAVALLLSTLPPARPIQTLPLPAAEAAQFVGKVGSFEGLVAAVRIGPRGALILELDRKAPHATLTVLVPAGPAGQLPSLTKWTGKRIVVRGLVQRIDGRIQITIERAADLTVAEQPDRIPCDAS